MMDDSTPRSRPKFQALTLPRIAALYCRVSTPGQRDGEGKTSLKTQREALEAKAAELGFAVVPDFIYEEAFNGEKLIERPVLSRLREDARARKFALVLWLNVYALAKKQAHLAILLDEWERLGISLDFVTEQLDDTPGRAVGGICPRLCRRDRGRAPQGAVRQGTAGPCARRTRTFTIEGQLRLPMGGYLRQRGAIDQRAAGD